MSQLRDPYGRPVLWLDCHSYESALDSLSAGIAVPEPECLSVLDSYDESPRRSPKPVLKRPPREVRCIGTSALVICALPGMGS